MFTKTSREYKFLARLNTAEKVQSFLDGLPMNHETFGETCMSPARVLRERKAHCIEGAFLATVCFKLAKLKPLIVNLKVEKSDFDHVIALFKRNGYYGAVSKTNHVVLRYRDPVYRSVRELIMSYFHEYFLVHGGNKTLLGYTKPINMSKFGTHWITAEEDLWDIAEKIYDTPIIPIIPREQRIHVRKASLFEQKIAAIPEWAEEKLK